MTITSYDETMFPFRRVLVALSGRDTDCGLLRYAAMLQRTLAGAEILCLHVAGEGDSSDLPRDLAATIRTDRVCPVQRRDLQR